MILKNKYGVVTGFILYFNMLFAQVSPDQFWILGADENTNQSGYGNAILQFTSNNVQVTTQDLHMNFESAVANMADSTGNLLFYTNGCSIANADGETMENGEGINPGTMHDWTCETSGYIAPFGAMALPSPAGNGLYILLHMGVEYGAERKLQFGPFYYSLIDMTANNGLGKVLSKNNILINDKNLAPFSVVRNGNGRDWWAIVPSNETNIYHKILIDPKGVQNFEDQAVGPMISCRHLGTGSFSRQGDRYARQQACGLFVYNFDRCSGLFSNAQYFKFPPNAFGGGGVAFTPDGKRVLTSTQMSVMAVDLTKSSPELDTIVDFLEILGTSLNLMQYGGDGKLYFSTMGRGAFMHVCKTPGDTSGNLGFSFRGQPLPVQNIRTLPNLPNYQLFDFQNSPCDTLGISVSTIEKGEAPNPLNGLRLYPNPAQDRAVLELTETWTSNAAAQYRIYNALGALVQSGAIAEGAKKIVVSLAGLPNGLYICQVLRDGQVLGAAKLTIVR